MKIEVCILDYGSGNVTSVKNAFDRLGYANLVSSDPLAIDNATHLILPGVGAFGSSMEKIETALPVEKIKSQIIRGKPFLGICVGMQVLAEFGHEFKVHQGLNLFPSTNVIQLPESMPLPHVGWNSIRIIQKREITKGLQDEADFYFVHSYRIANIENEYIVATCDYGLTFPAIVTKENIIGVQFHPEKSQRNGDLILNNFVGIS